MPCDSTCLLSDRSNLEIDSCDTPTPPSARLHLGQSVSANQCDEPVVAPFPRTNLSGSPAVVFAAVFTILAARSSAASRSHGTNTSVIAASEIWPLGHSFCLNIHRLRLGHWPFFWPPALRSNGVLVIETAVQPSWKQFSTARPASGASR